MKDKTSEVKQFIGDKVGEAEDALKDKAQNI